MKRSWLAGVLFLSAACAGQGAVPSAPPQQDPALAWQGDSLLAPILRSPVLNAAAIGKADTLASVHNDFDDRLAVVAMDSTAPPLIRSNAILLLSDRRVPRLQVYLEVLQASDDRVRASGVVALRPFLNRWPSMMDVIRKTLDDPSELVQMKALETLGDTYVDDLRSYASRTGQRALGKIALDLVRTAEERGAPLLPADSTGVLTRTAMTGHQVSFRPRVRWDQWAAAAGALWVAAPGKAAARISDSVEVVNNVVPAFFSADGRYLVYEANRTIRVRDLASGMERIAGQGIAPRLMPFTESFAFMRQTRVDQVREANSIHYDIVRANFADTISSMLGEVTAKARMDAHGNYSPVRWLRVRETDGMFRLEGDGVDPFVFPDPFTAK